MSETNKLDHPTTPAQTTVQTGNFVRANNIYILDTFDGKSDAENDAFVKSVRNVIESQTNPINVYVQCPDQIVTEHSGIVTRMLNDAIKSGRSVNIYPVNNQKTLLSQLLDMANKFNRPRSRNQKTL